MTVKIDPKEEKESTSLKIRPTVWKLAKLEAVSNDMQLSDLVEQAIIEWIDEKEKRKK